MRTTLKRGLGQGAKVSGNGRAVLPPSAPTPVRVYRQPPPERRTGVQLVGRFLLFLLIAVLMLVTALAGGAYLYFHEFASALGAHSKDVKQGQKYLKPVLPHQAAIGMVIGYDRRPNEQANTPSRSDTIMLLRADPGLHAISLLSFPRDMLVTIHCPGETPYQDKINAAYSDCGSKGTLQTVKALTGLPINYLITVNFTGFKEIVDHLGGVWIDVDHRYLNTNGGRTYDTYTTINLWPGYQHLKGWQALDYVRFRHTDSDLYRVIRQQEFVRAVKEQVHSHFGIESISKILGSIQRNVEVGVSGGGDLSGPIFKYANFAYSLPAGHFFQAKINGLTGYSYLTTDSSNIRAAVQDFTNPDVEAPRDATNVAFGGKPRVPRPEDTSIIVLNGNHVEGSAASAAEQLRERGYQIVLPRSTQTGNAPSFRHYYTDVYFNPGYKRAAAAARSVANLFQPARVHPLTRLIKPLSNAAMLTIVVGKTFGGTIAPAPVRTAPKREPPSVVYNPAVARPLVTSVRRRLPFRLEYPTKIESSSVPDPEVPVRDYPLDRKHRALRLTFRTGVRQYWAIEEMNWKDAPILSERNFRHFVHGREFDLYYSGGHLHMVVLLENDASYWVVNTLDDALSNDTMLAIARSLRPLKGRVGPG